MQLIQNLKIIELIKIELIFIMEGAIHRCKQFQWNHYTEAFNFFQSKSINMVLSNRKVEHTIHFKDMQFYDDDVEYLKRYYNQGESVIRVHKLINYYLTNMTPPSPNMIPVELYQPLENRHKKIVKLQIMKEKSAARRKEGSEKESSSVEDILPQIDTSKFSDIESQKDQSQFSSYDSSVHDLYEEVMEIVEDEPIDDEILNLRSIKESYLIIDFKKVMRLSQTEKMVERKKESEKSKKKTQSFMEYYNSISKKSSTNILEKYIKTKR